MESTTPVSISSSTFSNRSEATLYVPYGCKAIYEAADYWKEFKDIVEMESSDPKCEASTISYQDGKLSFSCGTEGAEFVAKIASEEIKAQQGNEISLPEKYILSVYATKEGYRDSDVVTQEITIGGKGDINGDGKITVLDVSTLVDIILKK